MIALVEFEFDSQKSASNKAKHGIDFLQAQELWNSKVVVIAARDASEKRYVAIGTIARERWSAIHLSGRGDSDYKCKEVHAVGD